MLSDSGLGEFSCALQSWMYLPQDWKNLEEPYSESDTDAVTDAVTDAPDGTKAAMAQSALSDSGIQQAEHLKNR